MSGSAATSLDPMPDRRGTARVVSLDALRGLAVAGIALMNVIAFAMPGAAYVNPRAYGGLETPDIASWALVFLTVEDKFRAIFAMLFGAGVAILLGKPNGDGLRGHYARMAVLFLIAMLHATLLAGNDILRVYAVAGLVLPAAMRLRPRTLYCIAAAIMAGQLAASVWLYRAYVAAWLHGSHGQLMAQMDYMFGGAPGYLAHALQQGRESLGERLDRRLTHEPGYTVRVLAGLPSSLAAMLIGIGLWRDGLLAGNWSRARALLLFCRVGLPSLAVLAAMAWWDIASGFDAFVTASVALVWSAPFDLALGVGWAALAMAAFAGHGRITGLLAAAGRMALTNYLGTSLVFAFLFASWGLGLFGHIGRVRAYLLTAIPIALMLTASRLWLTYFRQGPAEWAWRSLAQRQFLPFRRRA